MRTSLRERTEILGVIIGIDVGGSTTKIVGFRTDEKGNKTLIEPQLVTANDPITSTYGAFGKFTEENGIEMSDITKIMMTGVGSSFVKKDIFGLTCERVPEFNSIGKGALYLSGLDNALAVSLGTGTALVHAVKGGKMNYLGGTGVGGGTLVGLSKLLLRAESMEHIIEYADGGDLDNIDLKIKHMTDSGRLSILSEEMTASNFGNVSDLATKEDIALGIMNMVFETVAMVSMFAARQVGCENIVFTGNLTKIGFCEKKFKELNSMKDNFGVNFIIPANSQFGTVIGTALCGLE